MDYREFTARTVDDAITQACMELGVTSDRLDYDVLQEASAGFLGIGARQAVIRARARSEEELEAERRAIEAAENVEILYNTVLTEVTGDGTFVTGANIVTNGEEGKLELDGVFAAIGVVPETGLLKGKVDTCSQGFIACNSHMMTSIPGVFAAGDVTQKVLRQIITAAADGAVAVTGVMDYLNR